MDLNWKELLGVIAYAAAHVAVAATVIGFLAAMVVAAHKLIG